MTIAMDPTHPLAAALRLGARRLADATHPRRRAARAAAATVTAAASPRAPRTYRVRPGDTAASIAIAHGLSAASLLVRNGMRLRDEPVPGTELIVERGGAGCREARRLEPVDITRHAVMPGESVADLCRRFGVSTRVLLAANGLATASCVTPGVVLVVPTSTDPRDTGEVPVDAGTTAGGGASGVSGRSR
ncbi:hypothetical protein GCM10011490_01940 [Pseudoclavibacter endophyticus]|nr:LysM peptidoglycan-binding domain-containing protein [Pseudoclavibacter endophyticus]GGA55716.1 hypothetical protein GCM10011490_01940 [Pseudoclavibacter endophyticus]